MMKSLISATALSFALTASASAFAADLPSTKAPPYIPPPPPPMWTGFYGGLNAGYGWGTSSSVTNTGGGILDNEASYLNYVNSDCLGHAVSCGFVVPGGTALANTGTATIGQSGFVGGGQVGYNYQWGSNFVVGLEADFQGADVRGSGGYTGAYKDQVSWYVSSSDNGFLTRTVAGAGQIDAGIDWMGTVRGRIGYLFTPTMLIFATGGLAYGDVHADAVHSAFGGNSFSLNSYTSSQCANAGGTLSNGVCSSTKTLPILPGVGGISQTNVGWTVGGGGEWMFMPNWSMKAEALYYDLGSVTFASSPITGLFNALY